MKASGDFDEWDPENVAPLVAYLASDEARDITGQVFYVSGGTVQLYEGWGPIAQARKEERWTLADLSKEIPPLFEGRATAYAPPASILRATVREGK